MQKPRTITVLKIALTLAVLSNVLFWFYSRELRAQWLNIPPVPTSFSAVSSTLGDEQFAARMISMMIQNFGSTGGRITPIKDYDFDKLGDWLMLNYKLDPHSDLAPYMAAYYFAQSQDPTKIRPVIDYLRIAGNSTEGEKWRWLAQGVYLARFKLNDLNLALDMAKELAALPNDDMPNWARQMPVNVLNQQGEKEAALDLMLSILKDKSDKIHPNEVNAMLAYICEQILDPEEAKTHSLCVDFK
ncbi:MAG: hypothetical protein GW778_03625 [Alphaproteobacteria bacterium]|nr:hypothetical protein [Alphaproteobacteria bacterium]